MKSNCSIDSNSDEKRLANKWVWWIAKAAMELQSLRRERIEPQVGDMVIETTHILGLARHQLGLEVALGELVSIEAGKYGKVYTLKTVKGDLQKWENAMIVVLDRPSSYQSSNLSNADFDTDLAETKKTNQLQKKRSKRRPKRQNIKKRP